jgi:hypothetical protein
MQEVASNREFAERLVQLAEDFDTYDFLDNIEDDEMREQTTQSIEADLVNHNDTWMRDWLNDVKDELKSKIDKEDPDFLGHYIVECDTLLQYLDK